MAESTPPNSPSLPDRGAASQAFVETVYGDRLDPDQVERVRKSVTRYREAVQALHTVALTNADAPAPLFAVYRRED
jgi:hypothetical protein